METCSVTGKICYSRKEAGNILAAAHRGKKGKYIPQRAYLCEYCETYHLTSHKSYRKKKDGCKTTKPWYKKAKENYKNHVGEDYDL